MTSEKEEALASIIAFIFIIIILVGGIFGLCAMFSKYNIWSSANAGKAELMQADYNRQITVREAQAKFEAAKSLAAAEVERARGVASANKIIGDSLKGNESYLRYLWIDGLKETQGQVIYVPTEANLPILEASRHNVAGKK